MTAKVMMTMLLLTLIACSKDDGDDNAAATAPSVEVCIVFAPNELGDQGYADRVLKGMHQFDMLLSEEDYDRVQLRYIAVSDTGAVKNELRHWDRQGTSPYNLRAYERRLLVLTDVRLLPYLAETPLSDTDEVLVMNVANQRFDETAEAVQLGSRLHLLSISAAEATRKLCRHIDYETSHPEEVGMQRYKSVILFQGHDYDELLADSIAKVFSEYRPDYSCAVIPSDSAIGTGNDAYAQAYTIACFISQYNAEACSYAVCNWSSYNAAFFAAFNISQQSKAQPKVCPFIYVSDTGLSPALLKGRG